MFEGAIRILSSSAFVAFASVVTIIGFVAALLSLRLGLRSISDGRAVLDGLKEVGESLTTHRVGESPHYIDSVTKLVRSAKTSLKITTIFPSIGVYTLPAEWVHLESALRECQSRNVRIELLLATRQARKQALKTQFSAAIADWNEWSKQPANDEKLRFFAKRYEYGRYPFEDSNAFIEFSLDVQDKVLKDTYWSASVQETDTFVPLLSWVADSSEAFFAIANIEGRNTGFSTRDQNLIRSFESVRGRYPTLVAKP
jgi:hypothetical protein